LKREIVTPGKQEEKAQRAKAKLPLKQREQV
jgi:hypothetical protein